MCSLISDVCTVSQPRPGSVGTTLLKRFNRLHNVADALLAGAVLENLLTGFHLKGTRGGVHSETF